jgi:hypothetical protein
MSEPKTFMQRLDEWTQASVIDVLQQANAGGDRMDYARAVQAVKKAIREKVLESYRNGQAAEIKPARKEQSYAKTQTR